jgi:hypothetical protein
MSWAPGAIDGGGGRTKRLRIHGSRTAARCGARCEWYVRSGAEARRLSGGVRAAYCGLGANPRRHGSAGVCGRVAALRGMSPPKPIRAVKGGVPPVGNWGCPPEGCQVAPSWLVMSVVSAAYPRAMHLHETTGQPHPGRDARRRGTCAMVEFVF